MIIDCHQLSDASEIRGDYCVIGAGAAGITITNELVLAHKDVVLLESGGRKIDRDTQALCQGEVLDTDRHGPLDQYRRRRFGGTTDVWGGRCAPFDAIDFEARRHVPWSGWPIGRKDLDPYYARAHNYCDLGDYAYEAKEALTEGFREMVPGLNASTVSTSFLWRFSLPTDFGKSFWNSFSSSRNVNVYTHATALRLRLHPNGRGVDHLEIGSSSRKRFVVKAKHYIIASGGLETTRLLLVSNDVCPEGVGNDRGLVGRFYMSHITGDLGQVAFTPKRNPVVWDYERTRDGVYCRRAFSISEEQQRLDGLLNFRAILSHPSPADPAHRNGVLSAMYLAKKYFADRIPPEYSKSMSGISPIRRLSAHFRNIVSDWRAVAGFGGMWIRDRMISRRKLPSVALHSRSDIYTLHFDAEQAPNPHSRVMLSDSKDVFGINRLKVDWRFTDLDVSSVVKSSLLLSSALCESGVGAFLFDPERTAKAVAEKTAVGSHHIGTTRMAAAKSSGVVDENCMVHGVQNLYIASSSVFPTSSFANPTLTIVAMAIRLADFLKHQADSERQSVAELRIHVR